MKALVVQHDHVSPTGPVGARLAWHGFEVEEFLVVPDANFTSPNVTVEFPSGDDYDLVVALGAPWGAWDDVCIGNWLIPEVEWIRSLVQSGKPVLGICFGGQLVARALGGYVAPAPRSEVGWTTIFSDWPELVSNGPWFEFHDDRWSVPPGATEIARNPAASQAFIVNKTLAVQFHPEIEASGLKGWFDRGGDKKVIALGLDPVIMMAQTVAGQDGARERTNSLLDAYLREVAGLI